MESKFKKNSLAIIIPMFNEEKVAAACIDEVMRVIDSVKNKTAIIAVNDGSKDKTASILEKKQKLYGKKLIILTHKKNKGYGAATQTGIKKAIEEDFAWCLHMDSDLTNNPEYIHDFIREMSDKYDCIKASRYTKGGKVTNVPLYRRTISFVGNELAASLFNVGIKDCTNGFRMVRLEKLKNIHFKENNFSIILEELYYLKKNGAMFKEIPYTLSARINSISHFAYKPETFYNYFKYLVKAAFV